MHSRAHWSLLLSFWCFPTVDCPPTQLPPHRCMESLLILRSALGGCRAVISRTKNDAYHGRRGGGWRAPGLHLRGWLWHRQMHELDRWNLGRAIRWIESPMCHFWWQLVFEVGPSFRLTGWHWGCGWSSRNSLSSFLPFCASMLSFLNRSSRIEGRLQLPPLSDFFSGFREPTQRSVQEVLFQGSSHEDLLNIWWVGVGSVQKWLLGRCRFFWISLWRLRVWHSFEHCAHEFGGRVLNAFQKLCQKKSVKQPYVDFLWTFFAGRVGSYENNG